MAKKAYSWFYGWLAVWVIVAASALLAGVSEQVIIPVAFGGWVLMMLAGFVLAAWRPKLFLDKPSDNDL